MPILKNTWTVLKDLIKKKIPARKYVFRTTKKGKTGNDGKISDGHISVQDYLTGKKIWDKFNMKNIGDYHNHYSKKVVALLSNVSENFIDRFLKFYGLDPCHYFSSSGLSWDAMLKMTGVKLEKISDIAKYLFIVKGLRGAIPYIAKNIHKLITNTWMTMTLKTVKIYNVPWYE